MKLHFIQQSYYQQTLAKINLTNESLHEKEFEECTFEKCSFIDCEFKNCKFINCVFKECTLSAIKPTNAIFQEVSFLEAKIIGIDWTKTQRITFLQFKNSQLNYSNFRFLKLHELQIVNCDAKEVDFTEADLTESNFENTNFEGSIFLKTNLTKVNFKKAYNYLIDINANKLTKAQFSLPEAASLLKSFDIIVE
jgi:fluoroquinolone resistance protein